MMLSPVSVITSVEILLVLSAGIVNPLSWMPSAKSRSEISGVITDSMPPSASIVGVTFS